MDDQQKIRLFEEVSIPRAVMTLAIPTVISSLVMVVYNLADTYFVGALNDPVQNAAVTLVAPVLLAFNAVNNLFGVGTSSMMSRALGRKEYDTVRRCSAMGFYCALLCGILFSVSITVLRNPILVLLGVSAENYAATAAYLLWTVSWGAAPSILNVVLAFLVRAEGATFHASIGTMSGCILNIILDPVFILPWGLGMGAAGAGLATFISNCVACLYFLILLAVRRKHTFVCLNPGMLRWDKTVITGICAVGIPSAIQNLLNVVGMTVLNNFTSVYGSDAIAAMGISQKINMVPLYFSMGLSQGIMPLVSYNYGSEDYSRLKKAVRFSEKMSISFMVIVSMGFYLCAELLIRLFMKNEAVIAYGSRFLQGLCLTLPFLCMDFLAVVIFQACGMGGKALIFAILRKIVLEIPALYIWNSVWPLYGLVYAQPTAEFILAIVAVIVLRNLFRRLDQKSRGR